MKADGESAAGTDLELEELGQVEGEGEERDGDDVVARMAASDPDPERPAHGEVPLEADGQRGEHRAHLGHVRQAVQHRQARVVHVRQPGAQEFHWRF